MVDILNANVSFATIEVSRIEPLYIGIGIGILVSGLFWYVYLSNISRDDNNFLTCKLWL